MWYTDDVRTFEHEGETYRAKLIPDYHSDTSCLGTYTNKPGPWRVDCQEGLLLGAELEEPDAEDFPLPNAVDPEYPDDNEINWDLYDAVLADWEYTPCRILEEVRCGIHRNNDYRYFVPFCGGSGEELSQEEWTKYAVQDYERMDDLLKGWWGYLGIVVERKCKCCGEWANHDALWGIESDCEEYIESILINELLPEGAKEV